MSHETTLAKSAAQKASPTRAYDFSGKWRNQLGSKVNISQAANGKLSGQYESAVSGGGGPVIGKMTGFANGDLISFVVKWPSDAITAWVGQVVNDAGNDVIETLWQMTVNIADAAEPTGMWQSVLAGRDRFHKAP